MQQLASPRLASILFTPCPSFACELLDLLWGLSAKEPGHKYLASAPCDLVVEELEVIAYFLARGTLSQNKTAYP